MKPRRLSLALVLALTLCLGATPAHAARPIGGCPSAFLGPLDFATIIILFAPPGVPNPEEILASFDANGDEHLCVRGLPHDEVNIIDNVIP
jgi:hypothetical protein